MHKAPAPQDPERLILRPPTEADLDGIVRQLTDPRVAPWLAALPQPFGPKEAREMLDSGARAGDTLRLIDAGGTMAGGFCIGASFWYWLAPEHWGQGLMRRALTGAIAARFAAPAPPLVATCHEDNAASRALLLHLGFAASPTGRRMFFQGSQKAEPCRDYLLAPEQWHLLHPPEIAAGRATLHPAQQKDAPVLARIVPGLSDGPWPRADALPAFIETHRFRAPPEGLFVIRDGDRRGIGMALVEAGRCSLCFLSEEDDRRNRGHVDAALTDWTASAGQSPRCA